MRLSVWLIILLLLSCQTRPDTFSSAGIAGQDTVTVQVRVFPFPEIPATLTEPEARKSYLLTHYWDQFDFADTTLVNNRDVTEQGFVNFIALLADGTTPEELTHESLENWCAGFVGKDHARSTECIWRRCSASCRRRMRCAPPTVLNWSW